MKKVYLVEEGAIVIRAGSPAMSVVEPDGSLRSVREFTQVSPSTPEAKADALISALQIKPKEKPKSFAEKLMAGESTGTTRGTFVLEMERDRQRLVDAGGPEFTDDE